MEYPKTYDLCPLCQCSVRVVEEEINEEKAAGRIGQERIPCSQQRLLAIVDPISAPIAFPVLKIYSDICGGCGHEYPHTIAKERMTMDQLQTLLQQQMGMASRQ